MENCRGLSNTNVMRIMEISHVVAGTNVVHIYDKETQGD
jgi:hypothetical protein